MIDGLFFYATLTGRRGGHTPVVQAGAETSDTDAEAVEPDPGSFVIGLFREGGYRCLELKCGVLCGVVRPLRRTYSMLLSSEKPMSCCAAGTNGCLDLRRRASALHRRVSSEWSRCPDSMARRAKESVAPLRRSSAS